MSRSVQAEVRRAVEAAERALEAASRALGPGVPASAVDAVSREALQRAGFTCPHYIGHGVGHSQLDHPLIDSSSTAVLEEDHVVALEPGVYEPGVVGARVEHVYRITDAGAVRLTDHDVAVDVAS